MKYYCDIEDTKTGEKRRFVEELPDDKEIVEALEYRWSEGNWSCDCNRSMEFARAGGLTEDQVDEFVEAEFGPDDSHCVGHGRFRVPHLFLENGKVFTIDGAIQA